MKKYNFDKLIERRGTDSVKYDLTEVLYGSKDVLPMWVADMDFEVPDFIREAMMERLSHPIYGYTFRSDKFNSAVTGWMQKRHAWKVKNEEVSFSPGVVPALVLALLGFTNPGDKILLQSPVYYPFFSVIKEHKREVVCNKLIDTDGIYTMDFADLEGKMKEGVKMMFFCHPHNPTGRAWKKIELEKLAALAIKYDVLILSDEIHSDLLLFGNRHIPFASLSKEIAERTLTTVAPSKTFNLAGFHTSAVIIQNEELKKKYEKIMAEIHAGSGNVIGAVALQAAYEHGEEWLAQLLAYLEGNFIFLKDYLAEKLPELRVSPLEATYLVWMNFEKFGMDDKALYKFVTEEGKLGLSDGTIFGPGGSQYLRINIGVPKSTLEEGLERLVVAFRKILPKKP